MLNDEFITDNIVKIFADTETELFAMLMSKPDGSLYVSLRESNKDSHRIIDLKDLYLHLHSYFRNNNGQNKIGRPAYEDAFHLNSDLPSYKVISYLYHFEVNVVCQKILLQGRFINYRNGQSDHTKTEQCRYLLIDFDGEIIQDELIYERVQSYVYTYENDFIRFIDHETLMHVASDPFYHENLQIWKPFRGKHFQSEMFGDDAFQEDKGPYEYISSYAFHHATKQFAIIFQSPTYGIDAFKTFKMEVDYSLTQLSNLNFDSADLNHCAINITGDKCAVLEFAQDGAANLTTNIRSYFLADLKNLAAVTDTYMEIDRNHFVNMRFVNDDVVAIVLLNNIHLFDLAKNLKLTKLEMDDLGIHYISENVVYYVKNNKPETMILK
ncbi:hypothetical protein ACVW0P_001735 [Mucilaginibacter sp. UYNi724]